jgi:hypothetical protein
VSESNNDNKRQVSHILDGVLGDIKPKPIAAQPASITVQAGATLIIGNNNHCGPVPAAAEAISDKQRRWLRDLVGQVVAAEQIKRPEFAAVKVWTKLNGVMGVPSYKDIPKADFDRAKSYLEGWLHNLQQR